MQFAREEVDRTVKPGYFTIFRVTREVRTNPAEGDNIFGDYYAIFSTRSTTRLRSGEIWFQNHMWKNRQVSLLIKDVLWFVERNALFWEQGDLNFMVIRIELDPN